MKPRRVIAGPSPEEVRAEQLSQLFGAAGWMPSQANFADRAFVVWHGGFWSVAGSPPGHGCVSKSCQTEEQILDFLASFEAREEAASEEVEEVADLPLSVDTPSVAALVNAAEDGPREYPEAVAVEPDPRDEELERLRARVAELEAERPQQLPPNPAEAKLSDYGPVGSPAAADPVEDEITTEHLISAVRKDAEAAEDAVSKLSRDKRRRFTELLNVELAELQQLHGAAGENLARERDIEKLLGLFARVGERD